MEEYHVIDCEGPADFNVNSRNYAEACEIALAKLGYVVKTEKEYQEMTK